MIDTAMAAIMPDEIAGALTCILVLQINREKGWTYLSAVCTGVVLLEGIVDGDLNILCSII